MEFRRREEETKKEYYRRIAEVKKQTWADQHHLQEDEFYKSHFVIPDEEYSHDIQKSKKIAKIEYRAEQRLRNRVAAQQSRQRHRSYVEELQRKVKMYEQLLQQSGSLCKNCKKSLLTQVHQSESMTIQSVCQPEDSSKLSDDVLSEQALLNSILDDQIIRIDNQGATSPFGIFFILCIVAVIAVFSFNPNPEAVMPRLLANYQSTLNQLINFQESSHHDSFKEQQQHSILLDTMNPLLQAEANSGLKQFKISQSSSQVVAPPLNDTVPIKNWTKIGQYMCSDPEIVIHKRPEKLRKGPQFLLLRTGKNMVKSQKKRQSQLQSGENYKIVPKQWQRVEISQCFLGQM